MLYVNLKKKKVSYHYCLSMLMLRVNLRKPHVSCHYISKANVIINKVHVAILNFINVCVTMWTLRVKGPRVVSYNLYASLLRIQNRSPFCMVTWGKGF